MEETRPASAGECGDGGKNESSSFEFNILFCSERWNKYITISQPDFN
jgi:hypothetical protein